MVVEHQQFEQHSTIRFTKICDEFFQQNHNITNEIFNHKQQCIAIQLQDKWSVNELRGNKLNQEHNFP